MNVIKDLTKRIEEYRETNNSPCKNYGSEAAAEKAAKKMAMTAAEHFTKQGKTVRPARYVVFFIESWGRWVAAIDLSELVNRSSSTGGYLGICGARGFYSY